MTSLPAHFNAYVGSIPSSYGGVMDAIESYRRAQFLAAEISTTPDSSDVEDFGDEETGVRRVEDDEFSDGEMTPRPSNRHAHDDFLPDEWDEIEAETSTTTHDQPHATPTPRPSLIATRPSTYTSRVSSTRPRPHERTALFPKTTTKLPSPSRRPSRRPSAPAALPQWSPNYGTTAAQPHEDSEQSLLHSDKLSKLNLGGKSTYGQTLFNAIAILVGIGILSEPIAFAYAGWLMGTLLIVFYGLVTCYTAKILARIIISDPRLRSYSDIGRLAFGPKSSGFISLFFCFELFSVSVVLVTLYADSLHTIIPQYDKNLYKILGLLVLLPTMFLPLSLLSYASIIGILSIITMVAVIFIDGLTKFESPGSIWSPAETTLGTSSLNGLGVSFGLFMAGFSGHAVMPSLARDMANPEDFDTMINWAFGIATFVYAIIGFAGYAMFGVNVSDEISMDLLSTPGFNPTLNKIALWMLVISPLTKFALTTQPLNVTVEHMLGLAAPHMTVEDQLTKQGFQASGRKRTHAVIKRSLAAFQRVFFTVLAVAVSIAVPEFSALMSFLGSFSAFSLAAIGPVVANMMITKRVTALDTVIVIISSVMAIWGTVSAVTSAVGYE